VYNALDYVFFVGFYLFFLCWWDWRWWAGLEWKPRWVWSRWCPVCHLEYIHNSWNRCLVRVLFLEL